ncbi:MAG: ester cyclase [Gammaproteobacteria bacterium]|nr:ester cyclase [Gammaproteobacteria bacterium]
MSTMTDHSSSEEIVDYILRITREIWEDRNPDLVMRYYGPEARIHALGGIMQGAAAVTENTRAMQAAFPDRLVIGEDVVCSPLDGGAWLSSHRIRSPMTSKGENAYGPATGRKVTTHVMADCVVSNGLIEKEWLVRDNLSLVRQLGLDPLKVARREAARSHPDEHSRWLASERKRVLNASRPTSEPASPSEPALSSDPASPPDPQHDPLGFAREILLGLWQNPSEFCEAAYAPYAVLSDSDREVAGASDIFSHYAALRESLNVLRLSVDHAGLQARGGGWTLAARWTAAAEHAQEFEGLPATRAPLFLMGITHWWLTGGRVAREWTVFDRLALMEQILRHGVKFARGK